MESLMVASAGAVRTTAWKTLADLLEYRSQVQPEKTAYRFLDNGERETQCVKYGELARRSRQIGAQLQKMGASGGRVALLYPSGLEFISALFGCYYAGATAVPLLPARHGRSLERLRSTVSDADPEVALTTTPLLRTVRDGLQGTRAQVASTTEMISDAEPDWTPTLSNRNDTALLQYTSGSTNTPKGVTVTHSSLLHNQKVIQDLFEHTDEVMVSWLPMFHDMGLVGMILQPMYLGNECIFMSPTAFLQDPRRWLRAMTRYGGTTSGAPNFAYDLCVDKIPEQERSEFDLSRWRIAYNGSEPVRPSTIERFTHAYAPYGFRPETFYPCYGLAEASLLVTGGRPCDRPMINTNNVVGRPVVGCGRSHKDQQVLIVDPDTCTPMPDEQIGEIWISGPIVAAGYWNRVEETEAAFRGRLAISKEGSFLRTGDLGILSDGQLFVTGRLKELMIVRGRNHYPQDIEQTAEKSHPALRPGCGAAFLSDAEGREHLVVVQELRKEYLTSPPIREIGRQLREAVALEHGLSVAALVLIKTGTLPKTTSGKIQRRLCQKHYVEGRLDKVAEDPEVNR